MATGETTIGERIKAWRLIRGMSTHQLAARAGRAQSTIARIESGERSANNRFVLADIAEALGCSQQDLVGGSAPLPPTDWTYAAAALAVPDIRTALVETDLDEPSVLDPRPLREVAADAAHIRAQKLAADLAGAAPRLAGVLRELHAHARLAGPQDRDEVLRLLVVANHTANGLLRYTEFPAEAWIASERAIQAARAMGRPDPVMDGLAAWSRAHTATHCGAYDRARAAAEGGLAALESAQGRPGAPEMLGGLYLLCAYSSLALRRRDEALGWLVQAHLVAGRVGETKTLGLFFGPTNVRFWELAMEVEGGDPERAIDLARATSLSAVPAEFAHRRMTFYLDAARAALAVGQSGATVKYLLGAERAGPQPLRMAPLAHETLRALVAADKWPNAKVERSARGLAERMAVSPRPV